MPHNKDPQIKLNQGCCVEYNQKNILMNMLLQGYLSVIIKGQLVILMR